MVNEPTKKQVNERLKEIQKKMKGVKRIIIKIVYDLEKKEMKVSHSPKKRYDPDLIIGMLTIAQQWLLRAFIDKGELNVPMIKEKESKYIA